MGGKKKKKKNFAKSADEIVIVYSLKER